MKIRGALSVCLVVLSAVPLFGQSNGSAANPIAGTWTGYMGPGATPQFAITLELTVDGTGTVSGTLSGLYPGEIREGSFDAKTGALKLIASPKDDAATRLTLEGTVVLGTATGRVSGDNPTGGTFKITRKDAVSPVSSSQPGGDDPAAPLRYGFGEISGWIRKAADLVPAEKYGYRPTPSVRTFGQQIAHIADSYNYYCARAAGRNLQWSDAIEKGNLDQATLAQKLKQATDACQVVYGSGGQTGALMANIAHSNLHYGNLITYLRMLGLTPPSN